MAQPSQTNAPNLFGKLLSVLGLLGASLFFTGWVYRWAYYAFFKLNINTLSLPPQSFLIAPIQVFLRDVSTIGKTLLVIVLTILVISLTLLLVRWLETVLAKLVFPQSAPRISPLSQREKIVWRLRSLLALPPSGSITVELLRSLLYEIIIIAWIFTFLFWSARWQGLDDARGDARADSILPVVALISPEKKIVFGRALQDTRVVPSLEGFVIIGDKGLFNDLKNRQITSTVNQNDPIVWRFLLSQGGWIYLFITLPPNAKPDDSPYVIAIKEGDGQVLILSPKISQ